jgi:hypothetical protein
MKIVYLIEQHLDDRNYDRFGIQAWLDAGWTAEVWNLTPLSHPRAWEAIRATNTQSSPFGGYFTLESRGELERRLSDPMKVDFFVDFTGNSSATVAVKRRLTRNGAVRIVGQLGSIPAFEAHPSTTFAARVRAALAAGPRAWIGMLTAKANAMFVARRIPPGVVIVSGRKSYDAAVSAGHGSRIVRAHNFDYDLYLRLRDAGAPRAPNARPFAVFLDQDLCYHPEFVFANLDPYVTPERYFPTIRRGLEALGTAVGVDLMIAAHPRASYAQRGVASFEPIPALSNQTAELIRDCSVVVCHASTALQFAILFERPLIFATTNELAASFLGPYVETFAASLGKTVVNFDLDLERVDWRNELQLNSAKYAEYRNEYIKMDGTEDRPLWEIVIGHIEAGLKSSSPSPEIASSSGRRREQ